MAKNYFGCMWDTPSRNPDVYNLDNLPGVGLHLNRIILFSPNKY